MIRQLKTASVAFAAALTLTFASCESPKAMSASGMEVGTINTSCPIMPDHDVDGSVTVSYEGQKVGFCCKKCIGKWDQWDASKKAEYVKAAMAK